MLFITENTSGITFKVFIQPRSSKNMISGIHGDALKIKLTAPPVEGAANKMCIEYLAKSFNVSKSSVEIVSGHTSRTKLVHVKCKNEKERERLKQNENLKTDSK